MEYLHDREGARTERKKKDVLLRFCEFGVPFNAFRLNRIIELEYLLRVLPHVHDSFHHFKKKA